MVEDFVEDTALGLDVVGPRVNDRFFAEPKVDLERLLFEEFGVLRLEDEGALLRGEAGGDNDVVVDGLEESGEFGVGRFGNVRVRTCCGRLGIGW